MNSIQHITTLYPEDYPPLLREIYKPPNKLYVRGTMPAYDNKFLTVVGARKNSQYGREVVEELIKGLRGLPVVIVSGLALGIDSIAHEEALKNDLKTIAIPGSGIADGIIYPAEHFGLAQRILDAGGVLLSPFSETIMGNRWTFPFRNRVIAGISHATLVIEAEEKSGTLITSKYATEFNRDVLAVPGSIFSKLSDGPHALIRNGATPIRNVADLIDALGFARSLIQDFHGSTHTPKNLTFDYSKLPPEEMSVIKMLTQPLPRESLFEKLDMDTSEINTLISVLEIKGLIEEKFGEISLKPH